MIDDEHAKSTHRYLTRSLLHASFLQDKPRMEEEFSLREHGSYEIYHYSHITVQWHRLHDTFRKA